MMESAPTTEAVYQGVYTLYNNTNTVEQEKASKWLEQLQNSVYSWKIADELLQQKRDLHSCYFAAQTMRNKIQNSFHELPDEAHVSLRESLIAHISQITIDTNPIIVTQLCLALADLSLLMSRWDNPVHDLISRLSHNENSLWPLINTLSLIPEEISSRNLRLGANRRDEIQKQLEANANIVQQLLVESLTKFANGNAAKVMNIIKCFTSWICSHAIAISETTNNAIVIEAFNLLNNPDTELKLHDAAADLICSFLQCLEMHNLPVLETYMMQNIAQLDASYNMSVAQEEIDKAMNFCRIFTSLTESFLDKMINTELDQQPHYSIKSLDLVLNCIGHYDYEVAELTFPFWYRLSEELYQKNNDDLSNYFRPYIERLLFSLYRLSQMEPDHEGLLEENDSFTEFRRKVSDVIKDVVFIVGSSYCFKQMFLLLQEPNTTWESNEAALFVMENVAKNILPDENDIVPKVAQAILKLPENTHIAFRYTSIMLLGELCEWIDNHPDSLQAVLNFLLYSLNQKNGLAAAAASALTQICTTCKFRMTCHLNGLLQIAQSLDTFEISNESIINLLKGISVIVGRLPLVEMSQPLQTLCSYQLEPLRQLLLEQNFPLNERAGGDQNHRRDQNNRRDPSFWLDRIAAIIRYTNPDVGENEVHPCMAVLYEIWPILSETMNKYQTEGRIMERVNRCIRYSIRSIGKQAAPLLEPLVKQMVELYAAHHHSCFLYLGSVLVDEFHDVNDQCTQGLLDMMQAFIQPTFTRLQMENGLKNNPDTVDDFFRLCARFLQRCPIPFLQSPIVTPIIQCALLACTLDHKDANLSVMRFFYSLLNCGRPQQQNHHHHHHHHHHNNSSSSNNNNHHSNNDTAAANPVLNALNAQKQQLVRQIVQQHGQALIVNLMQASIYYLHSYMLSDVADVILEMKDIDAQQLSENLRTALDSLPKTHAKPEQLDDFHSNVMRCETPKAISHALKEFTRLYR